MRQPFIIAILTLAALGPLGRSPISAADTSSPADKRLLKALDKPVEFDLEEKSLNDVLAQILKSHKITVELDQTGLDDVGLSGTSLVTFRAKDISLLSALRLMLRSMDDSLSFAVRKGKLVISTNDVVGPMPGGKVTPTTKKVRTALEEKTTLKFDGATLDEALQKLQEDHKVNIVLDRQVSRLGVGREKPVHCDIADVKLGAGLKQMLDKLHPKLTYVVEDEVVLITAKQEKGQRPAKKPAR